MIERADVVVIGAGISGLAAAYSAQKAGASVIALENSANVGGVMQSGNKSGFLVEHGPTSMAMSDPLRALMHEIGLANDIVSPPVAAKRRYVVRNGQMHALPSSPPTLLRSELLSMRGKLRLLAEPFIPRRISSDEESLAALVRRRLGPEVLDYFVDPFVSGVCAGDTEKLSSRYTLKVLAELEQEHGSIIRGAIKRARSGVKSVSPIQSLRGGMRQLPGALRDRISNAQSTTFGRDPIRTAARVTAVARTDEGWEVSCSSNGIPETILAESVVCALPAHTLDSIQWPHEWRDSLRKLQQVEYAPIATVALGFRREHVAHPLDGFGVLFPSREGRSILGALFNSSMFEARAPEGSVLVTAFVGGARYAGDLTLDQAIACAIAELTPLIGLTGSPVMTSVAMWQHGIPQLQLKHCITLTAASTIENALPGAFFTGSYLGGVSIGDCLLHGLSVGQRAAAAVPSQARHLSKDDRPGPLTGLAYRA